MVRHAVILVGLLVVGTLHRGVKISLGVGSVRHQRRLEHAVGLQLGTSRIFLIFGFGFGYLWLVTLVHVTLF